MNLGFNEVLGRIDKSPLTLAKQRLESALRQAGLQQKANLPGTAESLAREAVQMASSLKGQQTRSIPACNTMPKQN